jgi:DNA-directed RNA polymerase specialized sigma24 family protein
MPRSEPKGRSWQASVSHRIAASAARWTTRLASCGSTPAPPLRPIRVDATKTPLEALGASPAHRAAMEEAFVGAARADDHEELSASLVRAVRDAGAAEDVPQDAFLRLTRQVRAFGAPGNSRAWLYRVAANLAVSRGRRIAAGLRGLIRLGGRVGAARQDEVPEARALQREARYELVALLDQLSPDARAALLPSGEGPRAAATRPANEPHGQPFPRLGHRRA